MFVSLLVCLHRNKMVGRRTQQENFHFMGRGGGGGGGGGEII